MRDCGTSRSARCGMRRAGCRLGALEQAGYRTVDDVLRATPYELHAVSRYRPAHRGADHHRSAASDRAGRLGHEGPLGRRRREPGQTQLLATLAAIRHVDSAIATLRTPLGAVRNWHTATVDRSRAGGSRMSMAFSGRWKKRAGLEALAMTRTPREGSSRQSCTRRSSRFRWTPRCSQQPCAATRCSGRSTRSTRSAHSWGTRWASTRGGRPSPHSPTWPYRGSASSSWSARRACRSTGLTRSPSTPAWTATASTVLIVTLPAGGVYGTVASASVDVSEHRPGCPSTTRGPSSDQRIVLAERHRLGIE